MDDSISRQAAIDAIDSLYFDTVEDHDRTKERIKRLPSVQPDIANINKFIDGLEEIFADIRESHVDDSVCGLCEFDGAYVGESGDWCNECPGFNRDDCFKLRDGIREKWIAEITNAAPSVQQWIPCSERLPELDEVVLATTAWHDITIAWRIGISEWFVHEGNTNAETDDIIAWMPLPEPYKGEQE